MLASPILNASPRVVSRSPIRASPFPSQKEAGKVLARMLNYYSQKDDTIVLSIKPAATPLAYEVAKELKLPLDLFLVRTLKIDSMTVGAVTDRTEKPLYKDQIIKGYGFTQKQLDDVIKQERANLENQKSQCCPPNYPLPRSENATVLLATDGIQTGQNARAAITLLKSIGFKGRIVLIAGVIGSDSQKIFTRDVDEVVAIRSPKVVGSVASWYENQVEPTNEQIKLLLQKVDDEFNEKSEELMR
ncbi:9710_t:CDS:2 [Acaulospora morrowiae]|uniref:9710_t:CDS:1 n=1 Tax=Acaulospora morrowiae TaxID=94023 RepID=A0A9N9BCF0_9GLOM|nr:9710_t:CDS:2 [Acaulospora morrowiae]